MNAKEFNDLLSDERIFVASRTFMGKVVKVVERNSKRETPVRSGTLRRSITSMVEATRASIKGVIGTAMSYARAVHNGSKPHDIKPNSANGVLVFRIGTTQVFTRKTIKHPGTKANPFFERGIGMSRDSIKRYQEQWSGDVWGGK